MRPVTITRTLTAAVTNSISLAQTTPGAANLTITGALASGGVATLVSPGQITLTSTGNISAVNFTITGTDYRGISVSEVLAGPNNNTVTSVNTYATITSIAASGAVGTNTSAGNAASGSSAVVPLDLYLTPFNVSLFLEITGTANATVQYTGDDINVTTSLDALTWTSHSDLTAKTASAIGTLISPVTAVRVLNNSGTGTVVLRVVQSGIFG
jgi:hypothetical protein